uniref:Secreted protein n=1 Tax=Picea sitchensis TaxID=3332 RepID=A9NLB4_PICSI|nr:unknown [Picea sitchensis]
MKIRSTLIVVVVKVVWMTTKFCPVVNNVKLNCRMFHLMRVIMPLKFLWKIMNWRPETRVIGQTVC